MRVPTGRSSVPLDEGEVEAIGKRVAGRKGRRGGGLLPPRLRQSRARAQAELAARSLPDATITTVEPRCCRSIASTSASRPRR